MTSQDTRQGSGSSSTADVKSRSVSPSPHPQTQYHNPNAAAGLSLDPSLATGAFSNTTSFSNNSPGYNTDYLSPNSVSPQALAPPDQSFSQGVPPLPQQSFETGFANQLDPSLGLTLQQPEENFSNLLNNSDFDFSLYQNQSPNSTTTPEYDSSLLLDPRIHQSRPVNEAVNPADLSRISSPPATSPQEQQQSSPGAMSPPGANPGPTFYTPQHSRHTSLDPSTAYLTTHSHPDWQSMMGNNSSFQGHRRAPSEVSEVSSAAHSPYMSQHESFDGPGDNPSPLLAPQNDPSLYDNALGIESFTLSDQQQSHPQQQAFSPAHSPYISPQLAPQQVPDMIPHVPFISAPMPPNAQYPTQSTDMYGNGPDGLMSMQTAMDIGQASQMAPPSINVEFAPPSRNNTGFGAPKGTADFDSLSPPSIRSRVRSHSDPYANPASRSRPSTSSSGSLNPGAATSPRSLSPSNSVGRQPQSNPSSREPSPSRSGRRVSMSSVDTRNYILDLADPQRPGANPNDQKRVQKHPATFQCHLCPKRFTRAYNLRSHLRTHTDERPFVCTVCGKAFARQHDRKRHEGLHSGEKKFVCRGDLSRGAQWGCGRRFARADALGRHFRSEAGRICIKPLLDEESLERDRVLMDHQQQPHQAHLQPIPQPLMISGMDGQHAGNFVLPAALIAQYPALQTLQWDQIPSTADDPSDIGGRSSFDASSGGEFGFDDDESGVSSVSGMSSGYASNQGNLYGQAQMLGVQAGEPGYPDPEWRG